MQSTTTLSRVMRVAGLALFGVVLAVTTGCASIVNGADQTVKVDTITSSGEVVQGANCQLTNEKSTVTQLSGQPAVVRRSAANLIVNCTAEGLQPARGEAVSRANAAMFGNILIGGAIGVAIDVGVGSGFSYPGWLELVFGEDRVYDFSRNRNDDKITKGEPRSVTAAVKAAVPYAANGSPAPTGFNLPNSTAPLPPGTPGQ